MPEEMEKGVMPQDNGHVHHTKKEKNEQTRETTVTKEKLMLKISN